MLDVSEKVKGIKESMDEFDAQMKRYTEEDVNSAGSRARKALMIAKKNLNVVRKAILVDQKEKKAARKAAKAANPEVKSGKKGKAKAEVEATSETTSA